MLGSSDASFSSTTDSSVFIVLVAPDVSPEGEVSAELFVVRVDLHISEHAHGGDSGAPLRVGAALLPALNTRFVPESRYAWLEFVVVNPGVVHKGAHVGFIRPVNYVVFAIIDEPLSIQTAVLVVQNKLGPRQTVDTDIVATEEWGALQGFVTYTNINLIIALGDASANV